MLKGKISDAIEKTKTVRQKRKEFAIFLIEKAFKTKKTETKEKEEGIR